MILAFDTYYFNGKAKTVCLAFEEWTDKVPVTIYKETIDSKVQYKSGEFYKRELPCILSLLKKIPLFPVESIIIDGFVFLDDENTPGLGGRLFDYLKTKIPVIGIAKSNFATNHNNKRTLTRGRSNRPLYVTAAGMNVDIAVQLVKKMAGPDRIPTLLKTLDLLTRKDDTSSAKS